jgi:hypothetical protein
MKGLYEILPIKWHARLQIACTSYPVLRSPLVSDILCEGIQSRIAGCCQTFLQALIGIIGV